MVVRTMVAVDYKRIPSSRRRPQRQTWSMLGICVGFCWIRLLGVDAVPSATIDEERCGSSSSGVCANSEYKKSRKSDQTGDNSCRLYMAPTTVGGIKGNYGIFTSVDLSTGASVLANDGPNIPVLLDHRKAPSKIFPDTDHMGLFHNVWWGLQSRVSNQFRNGELRYQDMGIADMLDLQINFGALPNCHPYRSNLDALQPADGIEYDDRTYLSGNHVTNPLRGSFSYYTGKNFIVDKPVEAGTELFLDYGSDWEQHGFPRKQDYFSAAALARKWILSVLEIKRHGGESTMSDKNDPNTILPTDDLVEGAKALLKLIRVVSPELPLDHDNTYDYYENTIYNGVYELEQITSRVLSLLPHTTDDWNKIYKRSWEIYFDRKTKIDPPPDKRIPDFPSVKDVADAMYDVSKPPPKSIQELKETGICLDHIVAGSSRAPLELETANGKTSDSSKNITIGRGAIAARFLPKGELVVPVPFLHLLDRSLFEKLPRDDAQSYEEVILNYCFGHSQSTLVMCPVTNAVLVNHCSDRGGRFPCGSGDKGPNAEYRWASDSEWDTKTKETLAMTLDDLAGTNHQQQHRMMSMEIVATRDIEEGEEIFIDYGEKWEEAWLKHVRNWSTDDDDVDSSWSSPLTSFELNHMSVVTAAAGDEGQEDYIFYGDLRGDKAALSDDGRFTAMCWYENLFDYNEAGLGSRHFPDPREVDNIGSKIYWKELSDDEIHQEYAIDVGKDRSVTFTHVRDHPPGTIDHFWPCSILSKNDREKGDDEDRYLVEIYPSSFHYYIYGVEYYSDSADHLLLKNYPRSSIRFVTVPYEGDQYHPKAFRHHIEIKDEIFPEQWKNKK